jgi:(4S)-4-hydroxy-5-phosphonooxypentane-2,3-dione isomerase
MLRSIRAIGAALVLLVTLCVLSTVRGDEALAQSARPYVNAVDVDIVPGQIDNYLAALQENGAASVHEPGCRDFIITVSQKDPNHVFIFEVYDDAAAFEAHRQSDHFKKYAATSKDMIAKRDAHPLSLIRLNMKPM